MTNGIELLDKLKSNGKIIPLDFHLASYFTQESQLTSSLDRNRFAFLICWLSIEVRSGHVCVDLSALDESSFEYRFGHELMTEILQEMSYPNNDDWIALCHKLMPSIIGNSGDITPFILVSNRLYFQRMWLDELQVGNYFLHANERTFPDKVLATKLLIQLFNTPSSNEDIDWQKVAVVTAMTSKVSIISGGPGTGKTTTISKILAIIAALHSAQSATPLKIIASAPTGKAAARLTESLASAYITLAIDENVRQALPNEAMTIHRLLGARADSNKFTYNKKNPLNVDILLIDEASMIDLSMMAKVIDALPQHARLILLGDKEQLSSVEAGAVFGDLCELIDIGYSQQQVDIIHKFTGYQIAAKTTKASFADHVCLLQKSYRFNHDSGIGQLANAIKVGNITHMKSLFKNGNFSDIHFIELSHNQDYQQAIDNSIDSMKEYLKLCHKTPKSIKEVLAQFANFRLLCALRDGPFGVVGLNTVIENSLNRKGLINIKKGDAWYLGRPIMILKNSFSLGLFNGDIGITLPSLDDPKKLKVYFQMPNGSISGFSPFRLPEHETTYAMTIHKSQGSEFDNVSIILPNEVSPILTRSLLYTAVTRAKKCVNIYANEKILLQSARSQTRRQSGLLELLADKIT